MTRQHTILLKCIKFNRSFCRQFYDKTTQACKLFATFKIRKKALNFELILSFIFRRRHCNNQGVGAPPPEISYKVPLQDPGGNCNCHQLHVSCCLGVNWWPLRSEDFLSSLLGSWAICLVPCLLSPGVLEWVCVVCFILLPESCSCPLFTGSAVWCVVMIRWSY